MTRIDYWTEVCNQADHIVWEPTTRPSVVLLMRLLGGTLWQTGITEATERVLSYEHFSFYSHVAILIHSMAEQGFRGLRCNL